MKDIHRSIPHVKTGKTWLFLIVLTMGLLISGAALAQPFGVVYNTNSLNLRADGDANSAWLGSYPPGTWVEITGSKNNFYYVTTPDGRMGYMSKNFITLGSDTVVQVAIVNNTGGGRFLNFRALPDYNANILGIFYNGVPLYVEGAWNGWYNVRINGQTGYVRSEYVRLIHTTGSSTVATVKTPSNTAINLRTGPGARYGIITQFPGDTYVMVLAKGTGWWRVNINGMTGFMSSDFLVEGLRAAQDTGGTGGGSTGTAYAVVNNPVNTQALNLRQSGSTAANIKGKLYNGTRLRVDAQGLEWCAVTAENTGAFGYVMTRYITLHNLPVTPTLHVAHPQGLAVNLRTGASLSSDIEIQVPNGKAVTVLAPGSEWTKVRYGGYTGYMLSYFLQK